MQPNDDILLGSISNLLLYLPEPIVDAVCNYAEVNQISEAMVLEMALASFLKVEAVSFSEIYDLPDVSEVMEKNENLKLQLQAMREALAKAGIPDPSIYPKF